MLEQELVDYGIQTEKSDIRVHVCPVVRRVYIYPTQSGLDAVNSGLYQKASAYQPGFEGRTAEGYKVPPDGIAFCAEIRVRDSVWNAVNIKKDDSTTEKGAKAVKIVRSMLKHGLCPIPTPNQEVLSHEMQINGTDILVRKGTRQEVKIQVKCDFTGGRRDIGGSGNLYLQTAEINPLRMH